MENASEKLCVHSMYAKSVLLEHDYTVSSVADNDNDENDNKENVSGTKFHGSFDAVDKWADSVISRAPTGQDRQKKFAREICIHKVKYPFLPEQQIRGKVYKKFGIPAVMGGVMSRSLQCLGGSSPKKRLKGRRKDLKKIEARKAMALREIPERNEKSCPVNAENKPDVFETVKKAESDKSNFPVIYEGPIATSIDCPYRASDCKFSGCPKSQTALEKEISILRSPQIVSPLQLDQLSPSGSFSSALSSKRKHEAGTFQVVRSSSAPGEFLIQNLSLTLDLDRRSPNRRIQGDILRDPSCIYSQRTQIFTSHFLLHNPTFDETKFSIYPCGSKKPTSSDNPSDIPGEMNIEDTPTQIYETSPRKKLRFLDANANWALAAASELSNPKKEVNEGMHRSSSVAVSEVFNSQILTPDAVIFDHPYSGTRKTPEVRGKIPRSLEIGKNPNGKFLKSEAKSTSMNFLKKKPRKQQNAFLRRSDDDELLKYQNSDDKENIMPRSAKPTKHISSGELACEDEYPLSSNRASPAKKKRDYYGRNNVADAEASGNEEISIFDRRIDVNSRIIDAPDPKASAVSILSAHLIPLRAGVPLFLSVDSLSNRCCEYDVDLEKITTICEFVNNFRDGGTLKEDLEVEAEEDEIRERIEDILKFLECDCRE